MIETTTPLKRQNLSNSQSQCSTLYERVKQTTLKSKTLLESTDKLLTVKTRFAPFVAILKHTFQTDTAQSFVFQIATSPTITVLRLALLQPSSLNHRSLDFHILQDSEMESSFNMRLMENYAQIWSAFWCRSLIHPSTYRKRLFPYRMVS